MPNKHVEVYLTDQISSVSFFTKNAENMVALYKCVAGAVPQSRHFLWQDNWLISIKHGAIPLQLIISYLFRPCRFLLLERNTLLCSALTTEMTGLKACP